MEYPLFSVIVPVYNCQNVIGRCLDSILSQKESNLEIIAVDDGSSDHSWQKMKEYSVQDDRVKIFRQKNKGVSAARNYALDMAEGDYIVFVDADDYLDKNYISELYQALCKYEAEICLCGLEKETDNQKKKSKSKRSGFEPICFSVSRGGFNYTSSNTSSDIVTGALFKASILEGITFQTDLYVGEDTLYFANAAKKCGRIVRIDSKLYHCVIYPNSACHGEFDKKKFTELEAWNRVCKLFEDNLEIYNSAKCAYVIRCYGMIRNHYRNQNFKKNYYPYVVREFRKNMKWFYKSKDISFVKKVIRTFYAVFPWIIVLDKRR